jgi:E3 ubiquitin-protein ligase RAD18
MAPTLSALLAQVPDPTDFPAHTGGLRALDGALRCAICAELLDAPAALGCGHSFCSLVRPPAS